MEKHKRYEDDPLRKYINNEMIEKAPEGFTSKTMARIRIEASPVIARRSFFQRNSVLIVSALVVILLVLTAFLLPSEGSGSAFSTIIKHISSINIPVPKLNTPVIPSINFPGWTLYFFIGMVFIALFDKILSDLFHREKRQDS